MDKDIKISDIKFIYFDMDGTFLTTKKIPSQRTVEMVKKLQSHGINCSIATGRPYYFAQGEIKTVKPHLPVISCNGALVYDSIKREIISFNSIDKIQTKKIYDILVKHDAIFLVYTKEEMFKYRNKKINPTSKWFDWIETKNSQFDVSERTKVTDIDNPNDFNIQDYDVIKFLIIYSEIPTDKFEIIESEISDVKDVYIVRSQKDVFDIMPNGLSKGFGLQVLHDKGLIDLNHTLVFGDAENDISMFKVARWSVAMGNADERLKKIATFVTADNDNNGIALFFDKLLK